MNRGAQPSDEREGRPARTHHEMLHSVLRLAVRLVQRVERFFGESTVSRIPHNADHRLPISWRPVVAREHALADGVLSRPQMAGGAEAYDHHARSHLVVSVRETTALKKRDAHDAEVVPRDRLSVEGPGCTPRLAGSRISPSRTTATPEPIAP